MKKIYILMVFFIYKMKMIKEVLLLVFLKFWNVGIFLFKKKFFKDMKNVFYGYNYDKINKI